MPELKPFLLLLLLGMSVSAIADFPTPDLLDELRQRLEKPPGCQPHCGSIQQLTITADPHQMHMSLEVHAAELLAVPLPVKEGQWWPNEFRMDGTEQTVLTRDPQGMLWILVPAGRHEIELSGPASVRSQLDLPLPLPPAHVEVITGDWAVNGLDENGVPDRQIQLIRKQKITSRSDQALEPGVLPPLLKVRRTIHLGLEWTVDTQVSRLSPAGSPIALELPLLHGEAVISPGYDVENGRLQLRLPAGQSQLTFHSRMTPVESIGLRAPDDVRWFEEWRLDAGPIWHVGYQGLPVIHHQDGSGAWLPTWSPWPGESVRITISRPQAVAGRLLTIDQSKLEISPGQRATDSHLVLELRASQGGQHQVLLPENALLRQVRIDGRTQPVRQAGRAVNLPIRPGPQKIELDWRIDSGIQQLFTSPAVDLGVESVNHSIQVNLGEERWTLLAFGPLMGPAVLFWSVLMVIGLIAVILGRIGLSPLRWYHWLLLGVGISQASLFGGLIIVAWLLALGLRDRNIASRTSPFRYNLMQITLVVLTVFALQALFDAIRTGLLGLPSMQISGNHSSATVLNWYQDRAAEIPAQATIISVPLLVYRLAMLAWALWLAFALLNWLKWAWQVFSEQGLWRKMNISITRNKPPEKVQAENPDKYTSAPGNGEKTDKT